jgi:hypothetical protein
VRKYSVGALNSLKMRDSQAPPPTGEIPVGSKISNTLKRLGFQSHNFLAQLLSETSRACRMVKNLKRFEKAWFPVS